MQSSTRCVSRRSAPRPAAFLIAIVTAITTFTPCLYALPPDRDISQYVRRSWTVEQGLPHGTVRGFAQTSDGYIWLATYEGLVRFNGERFRIFGKSSGIISDSIFAVCRTRDDTLWLGTASGLVRYRGGRFETVATQSELGDGTVYALAEAPDGTLWVGTAGGGVSVIRQGKIQRLPLVLRSSVVNALAAAADGSIWIGTAGGGLAHYQRGKVTSLTTADGLSSDSIVTLLIDGDTLLVGTSSGFDRISGSTITRVRGLPADQVTALERDSHGNYWIGTYSNGLFRMNGDQVVAYGMERGLLDPTVRAIFEDDEANIWIGSNRGLEQLRVGEFVSWTTHDGLSDNFTRAIFEDRDGVLWAGTAAGLNRWNGRGWEPAKDPRLANAYVLAISQSRDGTLWFGTSNGLYRVREGETRLFTMADGLSDDSIRCIHEDRNGSVWLATDYGLNRIRTDGTIESFAGRGGLGGDYALGIDETPDGRIWVATGGGLGEFDGKQFLLHTVANGFPSNRLFGLLADKDGTIWVSTDGDGLVRYRNGESRAITIRHGLANDKFLSIVDDERGHLWFGTARGAVKVAKTALHAVADGKEVRLVSRLYDESDGLGSRQCNGSGDPAALRTLDGRIWFATANGVSALTGATGPARPTPVRRPVIERVVIDGTEATAGQLQSIPPGMERIELEFTGVTFDAPERLRFRYRLEGYEDDWVDAGTNRVASYTNLPAGKYRFVLASSHEGDEWSSVSIPVTLEPHLWEKKWFIALCALLVLAILAAVHYARVHIARERARLLEKLVEERTREISEEQERTEQALLAAEAAKREAERHEKITEEALAEAEEANRAKSIFLATTSHELRTPLNAIIGFSDILISRGADRTDPRDLRFLQNIHSSGEYLLGIINNILDLSKIEAGRMDLHPETIFLHDTVAGICAVMRGLTTRRHITMELDIPKDIPKFDADPTQFKQIVYNLMANAVKFSPDGATVTIAARHVWPGESLLGEHAVEIRVIDHGIGIDPKDHQMIFQEFRQAYGERGRRPEGTGLGLALVKRFVEMHRGAIRVESAPGEGSTFIVILPCRFQPQLTESGNDESSPVARA